MENGLVLYGEFVREIKELIHRRQYEALKKVNTELIQLYWEIGGEIDRQQRERGWGKSVVEVLAGELQKEFPGVKGFTARNLWFMRQIYVEYSAAPNLKPLVSDLAGDRPNAILPPLVAEISWTKNVVIIQKCKDPLEREFYIKMTKRYGWTKDVLINNIENRAFEKYLTSQTNFDETVPEKYRQQAKLAVKDDYNFDFIEMGIEHSEAELEAGVIHNIRAFLSEMGGDFSFIGNQYHLDVADDDVTEIGGAQSMTEQDVYRRIKPMIEGYTEGLFWDFKKTLGDQADIIKDILAFSNSDYDGESYIIFGISEPTTRKHNKKIKLTTNDRRRLNTDAQYLYPPGKWDIHGLSDKEIDEMKKFSETISQKIESCMLISQPQCEYVPVCIRKKIWLFVIIRPLRKLCICQFKL